MSSFALLKKLSIENSKTKKRTSKLGVFLYHVFMTETFKSAKLFNI